jgi:hypothetical protein
MIALAHLGASMVEDSPEGNGELEARTMQSLAPCLQFRAKLRKYDESPPIDPSHLRHRRRSALLQNTPRGTLTSLEKRGASDS